MSATTFGRTSATTSPTAHESYSEDYPSAMGRLGEDATAARSTRGADRDSKQPETANDSNPAVVAPNHRNSQVSEQQQESVPVPEELELAVDQANRDHQALLINATRPTVSRDQHRDPTPQRITVVSQPRVYQQSIDREHQSGQRFSTLISTQSQPFQTADNRPPTSTPFWNPRTNETPTSSLILPIPQTDRPQNNQRHRTGAETSVVGVSLPAVPAYVPRDHSFVEAAEAGQHAHFGFLHYITPQASQSSLYTGRSQYNGPQQPQGRGVGRGRPYQLSLGDRIQHQPFRDLSASYPIAPPRTSSAPARSSSVPAAELLASSQQITGNRQSCTPVERFTSKNASNHCLTGVPQGSSSSAGEKNTQLRDFRNTDETASETDQDEEEPGLESRKEKKRNKKKKKKKPKSPPSGRDKDDSSDQPPPDARTGSGAASTGSGPKFSRFLHRSSRNNTYTSQSSTQKRSFFGLDRRTSRDNAEAIVHLVLQLIFKLSETYLGIYIHQTLFKMANGIPRPGPANLTANAGLDEWLEEAKQCHYLPERAMKELCEMVKEVLMEESNIQPVCTPVTVCGDIHGQFYDLLELFRVAGGMPGETNVQAPKTSTSIITSEDIEPPTEITNPKLKKKLKNRKSTDEVATDDGDDEETDAADADASHSASAVEPSQSSQSAETRFIFLGDFVDRGYFSLETFTLLMCLKAKYPDRIVLVRGNHESRQITQVYGFYEECQQKYGNASVWKACCHVFDFLVLAAIVDGELLCVHGGLSPEIRTIDQIRVVARAQEIPHEGAFCDLVWSDPEDVETWAISPRGAGWLFGDKVATEFNHVNGLKLIARAHQLVNEGYKYHFNQNSVVTVWSAPNYCYRCGNVASIMTVDKEMKPKFSIFSAVPDDQRHVPANRRGPGDYFL